MKKLLSLLAGLFLVLVFVGSASAAPMTWTETLSFDVTVPPTLNYYHDLRTDGFDAATDYVSNYTLEIELYDDKSDPWYAKGEWAAIWAPGIPHTTWTMNDVTLGWSLAGWLDINDDGTLNVSIESWFGDFKVGDSTLTAWGEAFEPVPEPTTMILFGLGLLGLAGVSRKKS